MLLLLSRYNYHVISYQDVIIMLLLLSRYNYHVITVIKIYYHVITVIKI